MLGHIGETLENARVIYGRPDLTKTEILKACRKDKGEWRKAASDVLAFLAGRGIIIKVGSRIVIVITKFVWLKQILLARCLNVYTLVQNQLTASLSILGMIMCMGVRRSDKL